MWHECSKGDKNFECFVYERMFEYSKLCPSPTFLYFSLKVVELLLEKGANYEHRNVSDYTPLSLAASGGYVNVIKLLLKYKADINSR